MPPSPSQPVDPSPAPHPPLQLLRPTVRPHIAAASSPNPQFPSRPRWRRNPRCPALRETLAPSTPPLPTWRTCAPRSAPSTTSSTSPVEERWGWPHWEKMLSRWPKILLDHFSATAGDLACLDSKLNAELCAQHSNNNTLLLSRRLCSGFALLRCVTANQPFVIKISHQAWISFWYSGLSNEKKKTRDLYLTVGF